MTQLQPPTNIQYDYVVETVNATTGEVYEAHHYTTYGEALNRFNEVKDKDAFIILSLYTRIKREGQTDTVHKLVLAGNK